MSEDLFSLTGPMNLGLYVVVGKHNGALRMFRLTGAMPDAGPENDGL